jgi:hypothetical protein
MVINAKGLLKQVMVNLFIVAFYLTVSITYIVKLLKVVFVNAGNVVKEWFVLENQQR